MSRLVITVEAFHGSAAPFYMRHDHIHIHEAHRSGYSAVQANGIIIIVNYVITRRQNVYTQDTYRMRARTKHSEAHSKRKIKKEGHYEKRKRKRRRAEKVLYYERCREYGL